MQLIYVSLLGNERSEKIKTKKPNHHKLDFYHQIDKVIKTKQERKKHCRHYAISSFSLSSLKISHGK
ncbi:hypothetical protein DERP_012996 [Dermatophagoides pteronyssinus]|uniref:Uncharacterized protein n=1 Tax=Dermatophagoides pteronyssinus TaxID=6956 RepID=A0ABQ8ISI3_DERPT|nr:hypothetical protein DERP_012996 [Dermatophagoides pteronyssinus]